jgi:hypothetical protein
MLTRKFGREVINYYAGSPLNRVSFLRTNVSFLSAALAHRTARFLLVDNLAPLARNPGELEWVGWEDVSGLCGEEVFGEEKTVVEKYDARVTRPVVLFLGLDERDVGDCGWGGRKEDAAEAKGEWEGFVHGEYKGQPYFAVDITPKGSIEAEAKRVVERMKERGLVWLAGRTAGGLGAGEGVFFFSILPLRILASSPNQRHLSLSISKPKRVLRRKTTANSPPQLPYPPRHAPSSIGTPATPSAPPAATRPSLSKPVRSASAPQPTSPSLPPTRAPTAQPATASRISASRARILRS